ncbi:transcription factor bHLH94-like isoform X3 [Raphanus sativus]|uniref:Transcription factor bHLH94-like isoform X3 n=1 Tax=Raphanus sativus TaxID=3726 RepID=A0A6J0JI80_RAPSA|nr:transcription factor bHLH94-like isoform X3 [Raphanus sativus]
MFLSLSFKQSQAKRMPLEAVVNPQDPFEFGYLSNCKDFMFHDFYYHEEIVSQDTKNNTDKLGKEQSYVENNEEELLWEDHHHQCPLVPSLEEELGLPALDVESHPPVQQRRKRRRTRSNKNKEEIENQRMTHITVERNRRKQMNEYLAVLRSLMPPSYAQRGDQASIVGGAISYVKELEHILQSIKPRRTTTTSHEADTSTSSLVCPFPDFFTFPQYSTKSSSEVESSSSPAEIEVTVAEGHANIKIMAKKKPRQLLKLVASIQSLRLTILHLNVTTMDNLILYSISVKVEEGSQLNTVEDIATALNQIIRRIQEES